MQAGDVSRESELQRLLSDERSRCDQYKQIYQTLKEQHQRLQDELTIIHQQLKEANEHHGAEKAANESYTRKLEETVTQKQQEINELIDKVSVSDPEKIRNEAEKDVSDEYQMTISKLLEQADENRGLYSELHSTYTLLKCQSEFSETENISTIESLKSQHRHEIAELKSEIKTLNDTRLVPEKDYFTEFKEAEKEIRRLHSKLRATQSECDELSTQNVRAVSEHESAAQDFSKQLAEHTATIRSLETEKNNLQAQKEVLSNRLQKCEDERKEQNNKHQIARHEAISFKSELDKVTQNYHLSIANSKREFEKMKTDHENKIKLLESEVSLKRDQIRRLQEDHARSVAERENSAIQRMTMLKQQMWQEFQEMQQELESNKRRIAEVEISKKEMAEQCEQKLKQAKEETKEVVLSRSSIEKELSDLKSKLDEKSSGNSETFKNLLEQNAKFRDEIEDMKTMISQRFAAGTEYLEGGRLGRLTVDNTDDRTIAELEVTLARQGFEYQQRIDSLESTFKEQRDTLVNEKKAILTKQKQYAKLIHKLREKLSVQKLQFEEMEVQNELLRNNIPVEDHLQLKAKLSDLQRKQEEFHQVMVTASHFAPLGSEVWKSSGFWSADKRYISSPVPLPTVDSLPSQGSIPLRNMSQHRIFKNSFKPRRRKSSLRRLTPSQHVSLNSSSSDIENL